MRVNDKVICIDDGIKPEMLPTIVKYYDQWVKKGNTYTIREIVDNDGIVDGVLLNEIKNKTIYIELIDKKQEPAFGMFRFSTIEHDELKEQIKEYIIEL